MTTKSLKATIFTAAVMMGLGCAGSNEEWSAEPAPSGAPMHLVLSTSANRLEVYRGGALVKTYTVSVGQPQYATPTGSYAISEIVWNPSWVPPASGWAAGKPAQGPGPNNPMGRVKMFFSNEYYIHGTSDVGQLGEPVSHGCVRMSNPDAVELARMVEESGGSGGGEDGTVRVNRPVPLEVH